MVDWRVTHELAPIRSVLRRQVQLVQQRLARWGVVVLRQCLSGDGHDGGTGRAASRTSSGHRSCSARRWIAGRPEGQRARATGEPGSQGQTPRTAPSPRCSRETRPYGHLGADRLRAVLLVRSHVSGRRSFRRARQCQSERAPCLTAGGWFFQRCSRWRRSSARCLTTFPRLVPCC